jgi:predicted amidophosphoribosyltransferase
MRQFEERRAQREAEHAAQMRAHEESVERAKRAAAGEMMCPACKREYPAGSTYCPNDANKLVSMAGHEELVAGPAGGICPACKRGFNPGTKVCPHDGEELVPYPMYATSAPAPPAARGKICPTCGGRFEGSAGFCGKDGTALVLLN